MKYTKKQLEKGMVKYYQNIRNNPNEYIEDPEYSDEQAIDSVKELISYMDVK